MTENDAGAAITLAALDSTTHAAYTALRDLGLSAAAARDALITQVADTITATAHEIDGTPVDEDQADGDGGVRAR